MKNNKTITTELIEKRKIADLLNEKLEGLEQEVGTFFPFFFSQKRKKILIAKFNFFSLIFFFKKKKNLTLKNQLKFVFEKWQIALKVPIDQQKLLLNQVEETQQLILNSQNELSIQKKQLSNLNGWN